MSLPKLFALTTLLLFGVIGLAAIFKDKKSVQEFTATASDPSKPIEIVLDSDVRIEATFQPKEKESAVVAQDSSVYQERRENWEAEFSEPDFANAFFSTNGPKFPFVETVVYKSRVPWKKGRPAWLSDYASHYNTSRHFIARSLNDQPDYYQQDLSEGDQFNVFKEECSVEFHLVVDAIKCKMWFYCYDKNEDLRYLIKTYRVGLGRHNPLAASGLLTPFGKYELGEKVAIYQPNTKGWHQGSKIEMIRIFGTRWIPFEKSVGEGQTPPKGLGIHGTPWVAEHEKKWQDDQSGLGKYESDGCIRLATEDIEELFSIVITKPTFIHIVPDVSEAELPGVEKSLKGI